LQKLKGDEDELDFYELYQRYKQAISCLEEAEANNRRLELKYQKFMDTLKQSKKPNLPLEEQIYFLQQTIQEQKIQIEEDDLKFNRTIMKHVKDSENLIKRQLRTIRQEYNAVNTQEKFRRKIY
jgi:hypothetical protein